MICCNHSCEQGKNCPVRQACEICEISINERSKFDKAIDWTIDLLAAWGILAAVIILCFWLGYKK
jgi:hypothetical protein